MVLARKTERASSFGEAGDCKGAGMRGVLNGGTRLETSLHLAIFPVKLPIDESLCLSVRLRNGCFGMLCAFTRVNALPPGRKY